MNLDSITDSNHLFQSVTAGVAPQTELDQAVSDQQAECTGLLPAFLREIIPQGNRDRMYTSREASEILGRIDVHYQALIEPIRMELNANLYERKALEDKVARLQSRLNELLPKFARREVAYEAHIHKEIKKCNAHYKGEYPRRIAFLERQKQRMDRGDFSEFDLVSVLNTAAETVPEPVRPKKTVKRIRQGESSDLAVGSSLNQSDESCPGRSAKRTHHC